jgi:hypothetical protein
MQFEHAVQAREAQQVNSLMLESLPMMPQGVHITKIHLHQA